MNKKPLIGVLPLIDYEKESLWMVPGYMDGISHAGGLPVMLPLTADGEDIKRLADEFDAFLFTGGQDVAPELYGQGRLKECGETSPERDEMELRLLKLAHDADKPVLGICRGIQFMNAAMGGTLYQDLPRQHPSAVDHHQSPPYDIPVHSVSICNDSPLYPLLKDILENDTLMVNSYHHSAVKDIAPSFSVMAISQDFIIEGICDKSRKFFMAIQWHPEFSWKNDEASRRIFKSFVEAAGGSDSVIL